MTSSNGNIFRVTGPLCWQFTGPGDFPTQRPVTRSFDVFFDLRLNKRLSKQPWGWWFEMLSCPLWRYRNALYQFIFRLKRTNCHACGVTVTPQLLRSMWWLAIKPAPPFRLHRLRQQWSVNCTANQCKPTYGPFISLRPLIHCWKWKKGNPISLLVKSKYYHHLWVFLSTGRILRFLR